MPGPQAACAEPCLTWPCPDLGCLPCGDKWTSEQIASWLPVANQIAFDESGYRFPGCWCYTGVEICRPCRCVTDCWCPLDRVDLARVIPWPVIEVVSVAGGVADGWRIENGRWLTPDRGVSWPATDRQAAPGAECKTVIVVRYGRNPPAPLVKYRDQILWQTMMANCPPAGVACSIVDGETQISENGRTITLNDSDSTLRKYVRSRYRRRANHSSLIVDLAEDYYTGTLDVVDGAPGFAVEFSGAGTATVSGTGWGIDTVELGDGFVMPGPAQLPATVEVDSDAEFVVVSGVTFPTICTGIEAAAAAGGDQIVGQVASAAAPVKRRVAG